MNKSIRGAIALLLVAGGIAFAAPAANATGTPPVECVPSEGTPAWTEVTPDIEHPAVGEPTITVDNPDYVPAVAYQPAVFETEYKFVHKFDIFHLNPKWKTDPNWNAESNPQSHGWLATGETRPGAIITPEVLSQDAIGEPTMQVPNPDYVAAYTENVPDIEHPAIPPVTCDDPEEPVTFEPSCTTVLDSYVIEGDGVITVPGGWASETISVPLAGVETLADIGTVLDIQADPIQYVGLHIRTAEGSISFEEEPSYNGKLWSQTAWDGVDAGMGYPAFGSIEEYIELNGDVTVTGIDLLYTHPEASSTTVESFTIGCTLYTFEPPVIVPEKPADIVTTTSVDTTDCESDTVTTTVTTTTVGHTLVDNQWVEDEPVVTTSSSDRPATDEECPVTSPVDETPTATPPATVTSATPAAADGLAVTGGDPAQTIGALTIGALAIAFGALATVLGIRRHRMNQQ